MCVCDFSESIKRTTEGKRFRVNLMKFCRIMDMHTIVFILPGVLNIRTAQKAVRFYHVLAVALVLVFLERWVHAAR